MNEHDTHPDELLDDETLDSEAETGGEAKQFTVPYELSGERLDAALAKMLPDYSRSRMTQWIKDDKVSVDGKHVPGKTKLLGGEIVRVEVVAAPEALSYVPEDVPFPVIYEDEHLLVVNKPAGMVVHPAVGNWSGTLLNGLLFRHPELAHIPRAGIVHRLDKDTSGLMVVAKTLQAQTDLVRQLQARTVKRIYRAVATGVVPYDGKIETLIGRDPHNRLRMAVVRFGGKPAITHLRVLERYDDFSYVECKLETGRTHQIRVHMKEAKHPLAGDPLYGNARHHGSEAVDEAVRNLGRQALHAYKLSLVHPVTGATHSWSAPLPDDMKALLAILRDEREIKLNKAKAQTPFGAAMEDDDDDWDEDDYDVETHYIR
ncbi:23S rRNA pseudouridine(1911/1915/1917) synthase RluD [Vogesella indigofera]|uniref:23S rRNA pseudouridine(1911/1915/1917) synthase RluD n=1 Tax=Vogesella indigofera TaxID=45465 RepID=UPI00234F32AC|nr:23S rRNA pseudouridine(1911/1915/1917) synthase RluD [Vogesella indigofera]